MVNLSALTALLRAVRFSSLLANNVMKNTSYFYAVRISISSAILSEIFAQIGYFF